MYIDELEGKTSLFIEAIGGIKKVSLDSGVATVADPEDLAKLEEIHKARPNVRYAVINPIRAEEKLVNFVSDYVNCNLVAIVEGDRPEIWRNVSIINMRLPKYGSVHIVLSNNEGRSYNRRQRYRLSVGQEGTIRLRTAEKEDIFPIFVKDISESGICFTMKETHGLEKGKGCIVEFADNGTSFRLDATVVRTQELPGNNIAFGCRLRQRYAQVAKYVNEKQKARMGSK